jgi:hypothetical protein
MRRSILPFAALAALALGVPSPAAGQAGATHLLVVTGAGGEPQYREAFHALGARLVEAARGAHGMPAANVVFLSEDSAKAPASGRSSKAGVERALAAIASRAAAHDRLVIVLIGHGSQQRDAARFNLPGPDITAAEVAAMLASLGTRQVAVVNAASASGEWVKALSGRNRVVITATRSGSEANATVFPRFFVDALAGTGADTDKDGRVSLLEAYDYARREVARAYESDNRLLTEHAQLDDDGDGKGTAEAGARVGTGAAAGGTDGALARRIFLSAGGVASSAVAAGDPRSAALVARRDSLQSAVEALRARKDSMSAAAYDAELERLLVALATTNAALRAATGSRP